jgi:hypothetical protein
VLELLVNPLLKVIHVCVSCNDVASPQRPTDLQVSLVSAWDHQRLKVKAASESWGLFIFLSLLLEVDFYTQR